MMHRDTEDTTPAEGTPQTHEHGDAASDIMAPPGSTGLGPDETDLHNTGDADDGSDGERFDAG